MNFSRHGRPHTLALNSGFQPFWGLWFHKHFLTGVQTLCRILKLNKMRITFLVTLQKTLKNYAGIPPVSSERGLKLLKISRGTYSGPASA